MTIREKRPLWPVRGGPEKNNLSFIAYVYNYRRPGTLISQAICYTFANQLARKRFKRLGPPMRSRFALFDSIIAEAKKVPIV